MNTPIVFFVIDGTLLNEDKIIPNSTKKVVRLLQEKGIHTVIATGRVPKMIYSLQDGALHIKKSYDPTAICN